MRKFKKDLLVKIANQVVIFTNKKGSLKLPCRFVCAIRQAAWLWPSLLSSSASLASILARQVSERSRMPLAP